MNMRRKPTGKIVSDFITPTAVQLATLDIDEVNFIRKYQGGEVASAASKRTYPLVDMVNPQPKAFFAYLQMPEKKPSRKTSSTKSKRITRKQKAGDVNAS